jgi:hypothetical protein
MLSPNRNSAQITTAGHVLKGIVKTAKPDPFLEAVTLLNEREMRRTSRK